jgi:hypothetical protein
MFRLLSVILILTLILMMGCMTAPLLAQTPEKQDTAGQVPAAEQGTAGQIAVAPLANAQYPLDSFTDFSAVMIGSRMEPGEGTDEAHIYRSGKLMRMEGPEKHGYFITDLTTGETYGISAAPCAHDTHPFIRASPFPAASKPGSTVTRVAAGKETVDGHSCQIENVTVSSPAFANPLKMRFWEAEDLQGFPIKIEFLLPGGHDTIIRYKNVVLGPQDPTLFIHPNSCEPLPGRESAKPKAAPAHKKPE